MDVAVPRVEHVDDADSVPAALEMMDQLIVGAVEAAYRIGLPTEAGAVLLVELDGPAAGLDEQLARVAAVCRAHGSIELRVARDDAERTALWKARKRAFGAVGRLAPNYCTQDGVVPRTRVPDIMRAIQRAAAKHRIRAGNVFHAGDGNIHPLFLFDERDPEQVRQVMHSSHEILEECIRLGGSVTGEHGIGVEKIDFMSKLFGPEDLAMMVRLRAAFNPDNRCSPAKMLPTAGACIEATKAGRRAAV